MKHISGWMWSLGACPVSGLFGSHLLSSALFLVMSPPLSVSEIILSPFATCSFCRNYLVHLMQHLLMKCLPLGQVCRALRCTWLLTSLFNGETDRNRIITNHSGRRHRVPLGALIQRDQGGLQGGCDG